MKARIGALALVVAPLACAGVVKADGILLPLDPGTNFMLYTQNSNDGYSSFRGMVFIANEALTYNGAALFTSSSGGLNATFELYEISTTVGNVLAGANLVRSTSGLLQGSLDYHGLKFSDITLVVDQAYLLRVGYGEAAAENWFFSGHGHWPYWARPGSWQTRFSTHDTLTLSWLLTACVAATFSTRVGLMWGNWMATVKR